MSKRLRLELAGVGETGISDLAADGSQAVRRRETLVLGVGKRKRPCKRQNRAIAGEKVCSSAPWNGLERWLVQYKRENTAREAKAALCCC